MFESEPYLYPGAYLCAYSLRPFHRSEGKPPGGRIVVCMIQLEHADAEYLASVLKPFLSSEGSLTPYKPTNTLIIRDREPVVNMLSEVINGKPCTP